MSGEHGCRERDSTLTQMAHLEFGHQREEAFPESVFNAATRDILNYTISLSVDHRSSGSGTLATIHNYYGILTAAHVVDDLLKAQNGQIAVVCTNQIHRLLIDREHLEITRFDRSLPNEPHGPDLAFVHLLDSPTISSLKAKKSFYPLSSANCDIFDQIRPKNTSVCCIMGAPEEMALEQGTKGTKSHVLSSTHFATRAQVMEEVVIDGFDYLNVAVIAGRDGFPENYQGVSGGGLWHIPLSIDPEVGPSSLAYERPELIGVAFYNQD